MRNCRVRVTGVVSLTTMISPKFGVIWVTWSLIGVKAFHKSDALKQMRMTTLTVISRYTRLYRCH